MLKRIIICALLYIMTASITFSDSLRNYFPDGVVYRPVLMYLQEKEAVDSSQIRDEYDYILTFLELAMYAHETNIRNYNTKNRLTELRPMLKNGELIITGNVKKIYSVDITTNSLYEKVNIDIIVELVGFSQCINTYNDLVNFWFEKNEEMLRPELDFEDEVVRLDDPFIQGGFTGNVSLTNGYEHEVVVHTFYDYNGVTVERTDEFYSGKSLIVTSNVTSKHIEYKNITAIRIETREGLVFAEYTPEHLVFLRNAYGRKKNKQEYWIFTEKGLFMEPIEISRRYNFDSEKILAYYRSDEAVQDLQAMVEKNK